MSKIILQDSVMTAEIVSAEGSRLDIVQSSFAALFRNLEALHTAMHQKSFLFEVVPPPTPVLDKVEFTLDIKCSDRRWKQSLYYTPTEKTLSMNWDGTTGLWRDSDLMNVPTLRALLLDLHRQLQITKVAVTWQ